MDNFIKTFHLRTWLLSLLSLSLQSVSRTTEVPAPSLPHSATTLESGKSYVLVNTMRYSYFLSVYGSEQFARLYATTGDCLSLTANQLVDGTWTLHNSVYGYLGSGMYAANVFFGTEAFAWTITPADTQTQTFSIASASTADQLVLNGNRTWVCFANNLSASDHTVGSEEQWKFVEADSIDDYASAVAAYIARLDMKEALASAQQNGYESHSIWQSSFSLYSSPCQDTDSLMSQTALLRQLTSSSPRQDGWYDYKSVPFSRVSVAPNTFWGQRLQASREVTIPLALQKCEESGRMENFVKATQPSTSNAAPQQPFDDTDVYKTLEGVAYQLSVEADSSLEAYADSIILLIAAAQEPDGYLYTARTMNPQSPHSWCGTARWVKEEDLSHETYNLGHLIESAIAYYEATGKDKYLHIAERYADCTLREVGKGTGQETVVPGHQIAEMALCKLYNLTGQQKYLDLARFFLDERGHTSIQQTYSQSQSPILSQTEAVGHAVRAGYMYAGIADVAALTGDTAYMATAGRLWENIVGKKMYLTGGVGSTSSGEAYGDNYQLPNETAYCETCAAISQVYFNYRMFLLHGEGKYYDVLERVLYNGLLDGVSLDGGSFFYPNPLASSGQHARTSWFGCPCCPSNIARFIPSLPGYVYTTRADTLFTNLYMSNEARIPLQGDTILLTQNTSYPWSGEVQLEVGTASPFTLALRIPGWTRGQVVPSDLYTYADTLQLHYSLTVNGTPVDASLRDGYAVITRNWQAGDLVNLSLDMMPRLVQAHGLVSDDGNRMAVERGPIVYCAEWPDNDIAVNSYRLKDNATFTVASSQLVTDAGTYPIVALTTKDVEISDDAQSSATLHLIPYYAWNHRGAGSMAVWLRSAAGSALAECADTVSLYLVKAASDGYSTTDLLLDKAAMAAALGTTSDTLTTFTRLYGLDTDSSLTNDYTTNTTGFWLDSDGHVCSWDKTGSGGQARFYIDYSASSGTLAIGFHEEATRYTEGDSFHTQLFIVYNRRSVMLDITVTVGDPSAISSPRFETPSRSNKIYSPTGQQLAPDAQSLPPSYRGIYIMDGKKYLKH